MKILGVDPGKTTGLAMIEFDQETKKLSLLGIRESTDQTCNDWSEWIREADVVVYENFLVRPKHSRKGDFDWSDMVAPRVIGGLVALSTAAGKELVKQEPAIKPVGYGFANLKYVRGKKGQHQQDAIAHAVFYAVRSLKAKPLHSDQ